MAHKSRSEQLSHGVKARKDPKALAKKTKQHSQKNEYKRQWRYDEKSIS